MATLTEMVTCLKKARENRANLEKQAKGIKEIENDLERRILMEMAAQGLKTVHVEGVARVSSKDAYHYELADIEKLSKEMFYGMMKAIEHGRPISDGLLLQQRISKSNLEDILTAKYPDGNITPEALDELGIRKVEEKTISLTKV